MRSLLSDDQEFFRATTARFLDEFASPAQLRDLRDDPIGFDRDYWRRGAELGWTSLLVSEAQRRRQHQRRRTGRPDARRPRVRYARRARPAAVRAISSRRALSDAAVARRRAGGLFAGRRSPTWCGAWAQRRSITHRRRHPPSTATTSCSTARSGRSSRRRSPTSCSSPVVQRSGFTQVLVPCRRGRRVDHADELRRSDPSLRVVSFDGVRLPTRRAVVGDVAGADAAIERQLQIALVLCAAESVGTMQRAFDITVEWAFDRYSFGRPLASYQALKHRFADMKAWLEASHAITDAAATAVGAGEPDGDEKARSRRRPSSESTARS